MIHINQNSKENKANSIVMSSIQRKPKASCVGTAWQVCESIRSYRQKKDLHVSQLPNSELKAEA